MRASNKNEAVEILDKPCLGVHLKGQTCVKETACGRFAVICTIPRRDGTYRLIRTFDESLLARRYNFSIHGERLGF